MTSPDRFTRRSSSPDRFVNGNGNGTGGVTSFNGRTGVVVPIQSDYDIFFLTQAEGEALFFTPTFIPVGNTFTVPENKQVLFATIIDNEGTLDVEGMLVEVDGAGSGGVVTFGNPIESNTGDTMNQGVDADSAHADHRHSRHGDEILRLTRML